MLAEKDEERKLEEEKPEQPDLSPFAAPSKEEDTRAVGWRSGDALTRDDVRHLLKEDRQLRVEYKDLRKALKRKPAKEERDPLNGLPPTWQAFWSGVPHLDAQAAFKQYCKEKEKEEKALAQQQLKDDDEMQKMREKFYELKQLLHEKDSISQRWEEKVSKVRKLDSEEEQHAKKMIRKLEKVSYQHGILQGQLRSSDIYYTYQYEDQKITHRKKQMTLERAATLLDKEIDLLKTRCRELLLEEALSCSMPPMSPVPELALPSQEAPEGAAAAEAPEDAAAAEALETVVAADAADGDYD